MFRRRIAVLLSASMTLPWFSHMSDVTAQTRAPVVRPMPTATSQPQKMVLPPWVFANIRVTVLGPNSVKIDWMPLVGADQYVVYRNGDRLDPPYSSEPNATQPMSVTDSAAPANSGLSYYVLPAQRVSMPAGPNAPPGTPNVVVERAMPPSATVTVTTPGPQLVQLPPVPLHLSNAWQPVIAALRAGKYGPPLPPLHGFVDLHAHPMSYLGFGGKLLYGAPDFVNLSAGDPPDMDQLPLGCRPNSGFAENETQSLGHENDAYGPPGPPAAPPYSACGNGARYTLIQALQLALSQQLYPPFTYQASLPLTGLPNPAQSGPPSFVTWPAWNDALRQKMYVDWILRAEQGGLRVMVALAVNSKLLGDLVTAGNLSNNPDLPTDDLRSADLQIKELHAFVFRHRARMAIVRNSAELYQTVASGKLAIVVGMEIDNIGNLVGNVPAAAINAEIDRLYAEDVRYIFPVHLVDNPIGKTAAYDPTFTVANLYEEGALMNMSCAAPTDNITWNYDSTVQKVTFMIGMGLNLSIPATKPCATGNVNAGEIDPVTHLPVGLSAAGVQAIQHMMDKGMLIDIDHMSQVSATQTLALAQQRFPVGYPLFSGHNNLRGSAGSGSLSERQLTASQYATLGSLHGMAGIGAAKTDALAWLQTLQATVAAMNVEPLSVVAFGTDADGMEFLMPPRQGSKVNPAVPLPFPAAPLPVSRDGWKAWDYNADGVAHYGMLPDFLLDVASMTNIGGSKAVSQMFDGAQTFYDTWFLAEQDKKL